MRGIHAFLFISLLTIIVVLVPYLIIGGIQKFSASYLYWSIVPLLLVAWAAWYTRRWFNGDKGGKR